MFFNVFYIFIKKRVFKVSYSCGQRFLHLWSTISISYVFLDREQIWTLTLTRERWLASYKVPCSDSCELYILHPRTTAENIGSRYRPGRPQCRR